MLRVHSVYVLLLLRLVFLLQEPRAIVGHESVCNEYVCASVVSKCLLTQSCQCKITDCHCCKDCLHCLGDLYIECCGCLDMCPQHNETMGLLAPKSQIGDFEGVPELFDSLTAEDDEEQWTTVRLPVQKTLKQRYGSMDALEQEAARKQSPNSASSTHNCTVIYVNVCLSNKKCGQYCESMGANSYRWFHDGCCECVGSVCINYGINESRCAECPEPDEEDELDELAALATRDLTGLPAGAESAALKWDFGEDEFNYN